MTQINLLTWREQAKQEKKIQFATLIGCFVVLALIFVLILHFYYQGFLSAQLDRNAYIQSQLDAEQGELSSQIAKKKELIATDEALHMIMSLRERSYRAVTILDALTKTVPQAVTLNRVIWDGKLLTIESQSDSNEGVSLFIENLTKLKLFTQPNLTLVTAKQTATEQGVLFEVKVELKE